VTKGSTLGKERGGGSPLRNLASVRRQTGGGAKAFVGSEGSSVAGEGRGMFLRLRGKEKTMRRGHIRVNQVRGGSHLRLGKAATFQPKTDEAARRRW
jgi:hypothetical protein